MRCVCQRVITSNYYRCEFCRHFWCKRCVIENQFWFDGQRRCTKCTKISEFKCTICPRRGCPSSDCMAIGANSYWLHNRMLRDAQRGICCLARGDGQFCFACLRWRRMMVLLGIHKLRPASVFARLPRDVLRFILIPMIRK